jgi:hypothetical protein
VSSAGAVWINSREVTVLEIAILEKVQLQNDRDAHFSGFRRSLAIAPHRSNYDYES